LLLEDIGCSLSTDTALDGSCLTRTGSSPLSQSGLRVLLAAIRDFSAVMAEAGLYAYANPMCSQMLRRWKQERMKSIANAGVPDHAGIRSENWHETES
jgi:hypothetical protein